MPDECQSMPITAPKDWTQKGWARRRRNSSRPYSRMMASVITAPSRVMRSPSHLGTRPPCSGRSALPARWAMMSSRSGGLRWQKRLLLELAPQRGGNRFSHQAGILAHLVGMLGARNHRRHDRVGGAKLQGGGTNVDTMAPAHGSDAVALVNHLSRRFAIFEGAAAGEQA